MLKVVVSKDNFYVESVESLFNSVPKQMNLDIEKVEEMFEEKIGEWDTRLITWGLEWESEVRVNDEVIDAARLLDRKDFKYSKILFKSPIGVDGCGRLIEFRTKPHNSLLKCGDEVMELIQEFLEYFPEAKLFPCGYNSLQINIGGVPFLRKLKFILDVSIYSIVRKLNLIRSKSDNSNSSVIIKRIDKGNFLWEYRPLPALSIFIASMLDLIETIVVKFYKGYTFNITIENGIGWLEKPYYFSQKLIEGEANRILFNIMDRKEFKIGSRIYADLNYVDEYFEYIDSCK